jgi:hypothetical protein
MPFEMFVDIFTIEVYPCTTTPHHTRLHTKRKIVAPTYGSPANQPASQPTAPVVVCAQLQVCSTNATHPVAVTVRGQWEAGRTSGGRWRDTAPVGIWTAIASFFFAPNETVGSSNSTFKYNPRFKLRIKRGERCYLTLEQVRTTTPTCTSTL